MRIFLLIFETTTFLALILLLVDEANAGNCYSGQGNRGNRVIVMDAIGYGRLHLDVDTQNPIGEGGIGVIFRARSRALFRRDRKNFAIKRMRFHQQEREHGIMAHFALRQEQNFDLYNKIVRYYGRKICTEWDEEEGRDVPYLWILMELGKKSLKNHVDTICSQGAENIDYGQLMASFLNVTVAVFQFHQEGVHLDIKLQNFICIDEECTDIRLIDFNSSVLIQNDADEDYDVNTTISLQRIATTPRYAGPEVFSYGMVHGVVTPGSYMISRKADIWSIGAMFYDAIHNFNSLNVELNHPPLHNLVNILTNFGASELAAITNAGLEESRAKFTRVMKACLQARPAERTSTWGIFQFMRGEECRGFYNERNELNLQANEICAH